MKLSDYLTAINYTKEPLLDEDCKVKDYTPFVINRCLSYFPDTILHSNLMNQYNAIHKKMQFDYYVNVLRKRKRYSKWLKKENEEEFLAVKEYFGYSDSKTKEIIDILTENQKREIVSIVSTKTQ
jgi:hypothetical protein